jgi:hypothetical protein
VCESSIEGESSAGGEEDDSYKEDSMDEFLGWPPELLLTPQPTRGLQCKQRKVVEGTSVGMAKEGGEGRGRGSVHIVICEGRAGGFGSRLRGEGAGSGKERAGSTGDGGPYGESGVGGATQRPPATAPGISPLGAVGGPGWAAGGPGWAPRGSGSAPWGPGSAYGDPGWGAGDRGWARGDEVLGGDQFHQGEGCTTGVGGWDPNFFDVEGSSRQYVGESSHANDDRSCDGLQDGIIYGDYFAGVNESCVPPMRKKKMIRIPRQVAELSEGSESKISEYEMEEEDATNVDDSVTKGVKHAYHDETWSQSFFTYEPKPRGL